MDNKTIEDSCPRCGGSDLIYDPETGEVICASCGTVIREEPLELGPSPEDYPPETRTERKRVPPETMRRMKRLQRYDELAKFEDLDPRTIRQAVAEMDRLVDELHLARNQRRRAKAIFRMAHERNLIVRGTIAGFAAASVYAACREAGLPRTLHEVSEKSGEDVKEVARMYRLLVTELDLRMPVDDPMKLVPRLASEVGASMETDLLAVEILREAAEQKALAGKDPRASAAAALYMACKAKNEKCTQWEIAAAAGVSEVSLRKRLRDLEEATEGKDMGDTQRARPR
jgi:transcription initiation factor TFIIB